MIEKRKFLRFSTSVMMEYRLCREKEIDGIACVKELSREGMRFSVNRRLDRGTLLDVKLILDQDSKPVFLTGEIVWVKEPQRKKDFEYLAGAKFFKIENFDKSKILDYAYNEWLTKKRSS